MPPTLYKNFPEKKRKQDCYVIRSPESETDEMQRKMPRNSLLPLPGRFEREPEGGRERGSEPRQPPVLHSSNGNINGLKKGEEQSADFR